MTQTLISERAQISNVLSNTTVHILVRPYWKVGSWGLRITINTPPSEFNTKATARSYLSTTCRKVGSWRLRTIHHLCILTQVLVRFTGSVIDASTDFYRTPLSSIHSFTTFPTSSNPSQNSLTPLRTLTDPLLSFTDRYILPPTYYETFLTRYEPPLTRYELPSILYTTYGRGDTLDYGRHK